jgi:AbrB family looped-hinge helix DNA binding protein
MVHQADASPYNIQKCKEFDMSEATLTSKGQITIPADIRKSMSISPKDRLTFTPMPDGTVVMRAKTKSIKELKGMLKPPHGVRVSISDMRMSGD